MSFGVRVQGAARLGLSMRAIRGAINSKAREEAMRAALEPVKETAKRLAPVRTGHLRDNIEVSVSRTGLWTTEGVVGVDLNVVPYARRIELGFSGVDSLGRVYNQAPHPYLRPAMLMNLGTVRAIFAAEIGGVIRKVS